MRNHVLTLMYHGIIEGQESTPDNRETGADLYDLPRSCFKEQMQWLKQNSCDIVTVPNGLERDNQKRKIVITFDDGELNNYSNAFPILQHFQFPAYFFITVNRVGKPGYMDWPHLKELLAGGMIIGSHGLNHEVLIQQSPNVIQDELVVSKKILEEHLQIPVVNFSVPRGFYDEQVLRLAKIAGYQTIFVSQKNDSDLSSLGRVAIKGNWSLKRFEQAIQGTVPWREHGFEFLKQWVKKFLGSERYDAIRKQILEKNLPRPMKGFEKT